MFRAVFLIYKLVNCVGVLLIFIRDLWRSLAGHFKIRQTKLSLVS